MSIFDNIGYKITQTSQGAIKKTKSIADVTKLNGMVNDEEKKINNYFTLLGRLYYEKNAASDDDQLQEIITEIYNCSLRIAEHREKIKLIKGFFPCPQCNGEIPVNSAFCPTCGYKVTESQVENQLNTADSMTCRSCGTTIRKGSCFCTKCGNKVVADNVPADNNSIAFASYTVADASEPEAIEEENKCPHCGALIKKDCAFCVICGSNVAVMNAIEDVATGNSKTAPAENIINDSQISGESNEIFIDVNPEASAAVNEPVSVCDQIQCSNCGSMIKEGSSFCIICGSKVKA